MEINFVYVVFIKILQFWYFIYFEIGISRRPIWDAVYSFDRFFFSCKIFFVLDKYRGAPCARTQYHGTNEEVSTNYVSKISEGRER